MSSFRLGHLAWFQHLAPRTTDDHSGLLHHLSEQLEFSLELILTLWLIFQMLLTIIIITGAPHWTPISSCGFLLSFLQGSHNKETILVVLILKIYLALNNKLKSTILRRKLFGETRSMLQEKNPRSNSKIINTNPIPNFLLN